MKCPYCAEVIQDDAIVCRFCSAYKYDGSWIHPATSSNNQQQPRGVRLTIRIAAAFFFISAIAELITVIQPVQMFGEFMEGGVAITYHIIFFLVYLAMGLGLWIAKPWGFHVMLGGSVLYTAERLLNLFTNPPGGRMVEYSAEIGSVGQETIGFVTQVATWVSLAGWWGFVIYLYYHRNYFGIRKPV